MHGAIDGQGVLWALAGSDTAARTKAYTATAQLPRPQARDARASLRTLPCAPCVQRGPPGPDDPLMQDGWNVGRTQWRELGGHVHASGCGCDGPAQ